MRIQIACAGPGIELLVTVDVAAGSTVADALRSAAIAQRTGSVPDADGLAIFGRRVDGSTQLREGACIRLLDSRPALDSASNIGTIARCPKPPTPRPARFAR